MTDLLIARFEKRFAGGPLISIDFRKTGDTFGVTALFGPSGCGKTTFLRCLAGLSHPDQGIIEFRGQSWFSSERRIAVSPQQRDIGFLFQEYALFPHLSVRENIAFGLLDISSGDRETRVAQMLKLFDLKGLEQRLPREISGGQQQRVALARTLARRPKMLLLDEPLSSLDAPLREQLRREMRKVFAELETPVILVTHDRIEAIALADRVAVMDEGKIQQIGSVHEVFTRPRTAALAQLVGMETIVLGEILEIREGLATIQVGSVHLLAVAPLENVRFVSVCIKGEDVSLQRGTIGSSSVRNHLTATITALTPEGPLVRVGLDCGFEITSLITRPSAEELQLKIGDSITAMFKVPAIHLVPSHRPAGIEGSSTS